MEICVNVFPVRDASAAMPPVVTSNAKKGRRMGLKTQNWSADFLSVSVRQFQRYVAAGLIKPCAYLGRHPRFSMEDIQLLIDKLTAARNERIAATKGEIA